MGLANSKGKSVSTVYVSTDVVSGYDGRQMSLGLVMYYLVLKSLLLHEQWNPQNFSFGMSRSPSNIMSNDFILSFFPF